MIGLSQTETADTALTGMWTKKSSAENEATNTWVLELITHNRGMSQIPSSQNITQLASTILVLTVKVCVVFSLVPRLFSTEMSLGMKLFGLIIVHTGGVSSSRIWWQFGRATAYQYSWVNIIHKVIIIHE